MPVYVSILTGKGYGAIGSILLYGQGAKSILSSVFNPVVSFITGGIFHGRIIDDGRTLDEVIVGCEKENQFVIHCHGNPILVQKITQLFIRRGAQLTDLENGPLPCSGTLLEHEASVEQLKAVTVEGVKIIQSQIHGGLSAAVKGWIDNAVSMEAIQKQCRDILERGRIARRIIGGVKIILAGPANSGKSTLLNTLAGGEKAIVSEIAGTTRDWVSTFIHIGPLRTEVIDTAGLGDNAIHDAVDKAAQQRTLELVRQCDCILWIEDGSVQSVNSKGGSDRGTAEVDGRHRVPAIHLTAFGGCHPLVIEVWNKLDLSGGKAPQAESDTIRISAKTGDGIESLLNEIQRRLQVCDFDPAMPAAFTARQEKLLQAITESQDKEQLQRLLTEIIAGQ